LQVATQTACTRYQQPFLKHENKDSPQPDAFVVGRLSAKERNRQMC